MYIFLDIDGVLNTTKDWDKMYSLNNKCISAFTKLLSRIDNTKIVLVSSWREGWNESGLNNTPQIKELSNIIENAGAAIVGKTKYSPDKDRTAEINHYLKWHENDSYIILDDDINEYKTSIQNLYIINSTYGITEKDVKKIWKKHI